MNGVGALAGARRWAERAFVLALVLLAMSWYMKRRPIAPEAIDAALLRSPVQTTTASATRRGSASATRTCRTTT